ncbi:MAG: HAD-IIIA family hydrolase, partial [Candidatus Hydrogenedentes bacterium]|nr:HAD-IIIA family hydrolase [Candidatus Hydrogenedentota bacterium]
MITSAVIAAGGLGTRMRSVTGGRLPKALLPVAGDPLAFRQMRLLRRYGVEDVVFLAGHLAETLREAVAPEAKRLGLGLHFLIEQGPLGDAGGLHNARALLGKEHFFFLAAGAIDMDLERLVEVHIESAAAATLVVHPVARPHESDLIAAEEDGRVTAIMPKASRPPGFYRNLAPCPVYCLSPRVFDYVTPNAQQDLLADALPRMIDAGERVCAYNTPEYVCDIATPERLAAIEADAAHGRIESLHYSHKRAAVFFDRDGVLNVERGGRGITNIDELELVPGAADAVRAANDAGLLAVAITNQSQVAKGFITSKYLERIFAKIETVLGEEGAQLDRIYYCPHHPEQGFPGEVPELKIACECRKPKPGMLLRAARDLPIDLAQSCCIGDTQRDIVAAHRAGVTAYGVRTGRACRDCTGGIQPVLMFDDARAAAQFAVHGVLEAEFCVEAINTKMGETPRRPLMVTLCGPQAAGKTMLAHAIARALRRRGVRANHVCADDLRRFHGGDGAIIARDDTYRTLIESFALGEPHAATADGRPLEADAAVNIVEGVYACPPALRPDIDYAVYVDAHTFVLEDRLAAIAQWMGLRSADAERLVETARNDEWPAVRQQIDFADATVRLAPILGVT